MEGEFYSPQQLNTTRKWQTPVLKFAHVTSGKINTKLSCNGAICHVRFFQSSRIMSGNVYESFYLVES